MRVLIALFFVITTVNATRSIEIGDLLCGCEYCKTVSRHEPLDIGEHMTRCHGWRKSYGKTMELMNQSKPDLLGVPARDKLPSLPKEDSENIHTISTEQNEPEMSVIDNPYEDYEWRYIDEYGWTYSTTNQSKLNESCWIYSENLGWVYKFGFIENYLYSETYEWVYVMDHGESHIIYWYDKRIWLHISRFQDNIVH